jgi:hypothetical protein
MNEELIKEFARQAGFKVNWQHEDVQAIKMAQYKEFAELIVRECISAAEEAQADYYIIENIKSRFGVEE